MNYTYNVMKKSNAFAYVRTIIKFPFSNCHFLKKKAYLTVVSADPLLTYISETCGKLICWILIYKTHGDNVSAVILATVAVATQELPNFNIAEFPRWNCNRKC